MTGGIGFSSQGRDSFKKNRERLNKRGLMKDNPYSSINKVDRLKAVNYEEIADYKRSKAKKDLTRTIVIWSIIGLTIIISIITAVLVN